VRRRRALITALTVFAQKADQARADFADNLDFIKAQLARIPTR
jgi:hypothetical protein